MLMMALRDEPITDIDQLPVVLIAEDLAKLLRREVRTVRRHDKLGLIPASHRQTWTRVEILAWMKAGRPDRETWEQIRVKQLSKEKL